MFVIIISGLVLFSLKRVTSVYSLVFGWDPELCHCSPIHSNMLFYRPKFFAELTCSFAPALTLYILPRSSVNGVQLFVFSSSSAVVAAKCIQCSLMSMYFIATVVFFTSK
jgi:hypothetical protein